ncbi:MAG: hypothetical protein NTV58_15050 [Deltaproteobacteria bacterium]|nr:hypothetical protein [Deltaproteobacteria bacterium]
MKTRDKIKSGLSEASEILAACNEKAIVLKLVNDFAAQEDCFPGTKEEDLVLVYGGISRILYEIMQQVSEAQDLINCCESDIDVLGKPAKEVAS